LLQKGGQIEKKWGYFQRGKKSKGGDQGGGVGEDQSSNGEKKVFVTARKKTGERPKTPSPR